MRRRREMHSGCAENLVRQVERVFRTGVLSIHTRKRYRDACLRFAAWAAESAGLESLRLVTGAHLAAYVAAMEDRGVKPKTIRTDLTAINYAHSMLVLEGKSVAEKELPTADELGVAKPELVPDRRWSEADVEWMIEVAEAAGEERWADAIRLGFLLGLRIHEVFRLSRADVEPHALKRGVLRVIGKGGRRREVPLVPEAVAILEKWRKRVARGQKLFVRVDERTGEVIKALQDFIRENRPEPEEGYSPLTFHGLRYSYAQREERRLKEAGVGKEQRRLEISRKLGHSRPGITATYVRY